MIAAARLGLRVGAIGHLGSDEYGQWTERWLQAEGIAPTVPIQPPDQPRRLERTLVCFVLVDPQGRHSFCSAYDFGPWPLLAGVTQLPPAVKQALQSTHAVVANGFVFDDLPLELVQDAARTASEAGAAIVFDPGPRCFTMREGSRRHALETMLDLSDVVLMTLEEARVVTGHSDPAAAAQSILDRPGANTRWCVVKEGADGALLMARDRPGAHQAQAIPVDVSDTVGCGDSFAAAVVLGYIRGHDIAATLVLANAVGAATAMGRGAGRNVATAERVQELLGRAMQAGSHSAVTVQQALDMLHSSLRRSDGVLAGPQRTPKSNGAGVGNGNGAASRSSSASPQEVKHR